jgi:hypothetical protein
MSVEMEFRPGDMQFIHNHQILHSRTDFEDWPEPEKRRHLLRLPCHPICQRHRPGQPLVGQILECQDLWRVVRWAK